MSVDAPLHLFEAFGVELEYMIVDARTLDVRPITDRLFEAVAGEITSDIELGEVSWSNELAAHVVELKTTEPARSLGLLPQVFQESVGRINVALEPLGGLLMPSAMHPWMDPHREMVLWAHDFSVVYEAFNRIFDCRGHGWANLQSVHLNLPFADDEEFGRLHAAIRVLLPLLPALAASSPIMDGTFSGLMDTRLDVYRHNCRRIPSATARVIPEPVFSAADYRSIILEPLFADIAPLDPEGILQHEWLNARGAIARFERNAIEVRVLDVQECPQADVAVCALIADVLEALAGGRWGDPAELKLCDTEQLSTLLLASIRDAERTVIDDTSYLRLFGIPGGTPLQAGALWKHLAKQVRPGGRSNHPNVRPAVDFLVEQGTLARRIVTALGTDPSRERIAFVYRQLCQCLATGSLFAPQGERSTMRPS